jgi:gliding motility-associated-like protein
MTFSTTVRLRRGLLHRSLLALLPVFALLMLAFPARATHLRAGDIQATSDSLNLLRYRFVLRLYTDDRSRIDEPTATICFGDGTTAVIQRLSKTPLPGCTQVSENVYRFEHIYPGPNQYAVSYIGNNRNGTILNLGASPDDLSIYIETQILIDPTLPGQNSGPGRNRSAVFNTRPIQQGTVGQIFTHAPGASDLDNDSLSFQLITPRQGRLNGGPCDSPLDITAYQPLNLYANAPAVFTMDPTTGLVTWNSPSGPGEYNIAYIVKEWRSLGQGVVRQVGSVVRDMQITITGGGNLPPVLRIPRDTCVVANTPLVRLISATDPNSNTVTLTGEGGPFVSTTPRAQLATVSTNPRVMRFSWTPDCRQVARQPYLATFTALDAPANCQAQLSALAVWKIRVVGPAPQALRATVTGPRQIRLRWNPYPCAGAADSIRIYRKLDSTAFEPDVCETGIPPRLGYTYIGSVAASDTSFLDNNRGRRFKLGSTYCYRIYATWPLPGRGESLASAEACATIPGLLPMLTNATVDQTDLSIGQNTVKWTRGNHGIAITIYEEYYRLSRAADNDTAAYTVLRNRIPLADTTYIDTGLNTFERQYRYRLEFVLARLNGPEEEIDTVDIATTPRLTGERDTTQISLTWKYQVPWDNTARRHIIYRKIAGAYVAIDSVQAGRLSGSYIDRFTYQGIPIGREQTNCYQIKTVGKYVVGQRDPANTENFSQELCFKNLPCPPVLAIQAPDCAAEAQSCPQGGFENVLTWVPNTGGACATDLKEWRIYYRPTAEGDFTLLATLPIEQLTYTHAPLASRVGCYAVTAVDGSNNESDQSNIVCQDNCELFTLPNIITPDGDNRNDQVVPICASPLRRVKFTVYNRWGRRVYESDSDPQIRWGGTADNGTRLADGTYFYRAEVEFDVLNPTPRFFKGWVEIAAGRDGGGVTR